MRSDILKRFYVIFLTIFQIIVDFVIVEFSFFLGYFLWMTLNPRGHFQPIGLYVRPFLFSGIIFVVIFYFLGLYQRRVSLLNIEEPKNIIKGIIIGFLLILAVSYFYRVTAFSRLVIVYSIIFMSVLVFLERMILSELHEWFHKKGISSHPIIIYGAGKVGQALLKKLKQYPRLGYVPIGFIDDNLEPGTTINDSKILGNMEDLDELRERHQFHYLFIAMPSVSSDHITDVINRCRAKGISFKVVPNLYEIALERSRLDIIEGIPLVDVKVFKTKLSTNIIKRIFDIIFSIIVFIILSPLILIVSILIKRDSKGPVFFKHERMGKDGKVFELYKFRTMYCDTEPYENCPKSLDDSRITPFGRWVRKTSIDELPQLINVFKGEMSVVGPRPEMPFIVEQYDDVQRERLKVKPGITGLWQISGDRSKEIHENIEYDLYYIENQSLLLDLAIFLRTIICVVRGLGI